MQIKPETLPSYCVSVKAVVMRHLQIFFFPGSSAEDFLWSVLHFCCSHFNFGSVIYNLKKLGRLRSFVKLYVDTQNVWRVKDPCNKIIKYAEERDRRSFVASREATFQLSLRTLTIFVKDVNRINTLPIEFPVVIRSMLVLFDACTSFPSASVKQRTIFALREGQYGLFEAPD